MYIERYKLILIVVCVIVAFGVVGRSDSEAERMQEDEHCAMVKLWKETGGEAGWPAFYSDKVCE
jgi:hypothetical protein